VIVNMSPIDTRTPLSCQPRPASTSTTATSWPNRVVGTSKQLRTAGANSARISPQRREGLSGLAFDLVARNPQRITMPE
jgi:hypothetical protein